MTGYVLGCRVQAEWEEFEGRRAGSSGAVPPSSLLSRYSAIKQFTSGRGFQLNSIKHQQCSIRSLLYPSPTIPPLFPNVTPHLLRRSRRHSFLFRTRVLPWIPVWLSEGSRREFGWLARAVSAFSTVIRGPTSASLGGMYTHRCLF